LHAVQRLGLAVNEIPNPLQVYIVEDSTIIRRLLTSTIEAAGAEMVGSSAGAQSAIADLSVLRPDLILIDISLNSGSGFDVLRALQERKLVPSAIKVVLTNHANPEYESLSLRLGASRFFDKSSETSQVLALINALAAERRRGATQSRGPDHHGSGNHSLN
jgi:DNA-binding NarL/FixJ family response regulator